MNKNLMIGLGVLAVAGIGLYMWKRRKDGENSEEKSSVTGDKNKPRRKLLAIRQNF